MKAFMTGLLFPTLSFASTKPPKAEKIAHEMKANGDLRNDPYYWIRDAKNPKVIKHLKAENAYYKSYFSKADLKLQKKLLEEVKTKIEESESSPEIIFGKYAYFSKIEKGQDYRQYLRRDTVSHKEDLLFDENVRAKGKGFFAVRARSMSPDLKKMVWCFDYDGSGKCEVEIQDMQTLVFEKTKIKNIYWGNVVWGKDSRSLFYTLANSAWRPDSIWMLNEKRETSKVFSEDDELYNLNVYLSTDHQFVLAQADSYDQSKTYYWDGIAFQPLVPMENKILATVDHTEAGFFARSNHAHKNYGIYLIPKIGDSSKVWKEIVAPQKNAKLTEMSLLQNTAAYSLLAKGNEEIHLVDINSKKEKPVSFTEATYSTSFFVDGNPSALFVSYSSPISPVKTYRVDLDTAALTLIKEKKSPTLNSSLYVTELKMVKARDGKEIPIHLVYRKDLRKGEAQPALLYSYGSYGSTIPSGFSESLFSLLDLGFIYINAHIRGSDAQGEDWYEDGKMMNKKNTFNDFIDVSDFLIKEKWTTPHLLAIRGGSAGGLLIGAVINQKPENFRAAIAEVPFVDVITTMLDSTLPLTTQEYLQWGNPNEPEAYTYMRSYSPYDNIKKQKYPAVLVQTGLTDQQVSYWEPTKWVLRLRDENTGSSPIILKCNMGAGHGGASGRYKRYEENAEKYVFLIKELGLTNP